MDGRVAIRRARIAVSAVFASICMFVVALWMGTFVRADMAWGPIPRGGCFVVVSAPGYMQLAITLKYLGRAAPWGVSTHTVEPNSVGNILNLNFGAFRFGRGDRADEFSVSAPHWFVVLVTAACAALPLVKWQLRFTLRTVFVTFAVASLVMWMFVEIWR
jgi:hypothetical protein